MKLNQLPEDYDEAKLGPQKRRTEFDPPEAKLTYDAQGLIAKAKLQSERLGRSVDPITFVQRKDDNIKALQAAINKEQGVVRPAVDAVMAKAAEPGPELSPEQIWLGEFQTRFNALSKLHTGIEWSDVEKSLRADPESMKKLQALDEKGHKMNVFGEEGDEFIFVSAWDKYEQVAQDHRNIAYDPEGQKLAEEQGYKPNGNAVSILAGIMGVEEDEAGNYLADTKFHEQLRRAIAVNGWAWLKTDAATRATGVAFIGNFNGIVRFFARARDAYGSFRAALRVKKA